MTTAPLPRGRRLFVHLQSDRPVKWHHSVVLADHWRLVNGIELYDIAADPGQRRDLAAVHPEVAAELRVAYEEWWESLAAPFPEHCCLPLAPPQEPATLLTARDWHPTEGTIPWRQAWVEEEERYPNGFWMVAAAAGAPLHMALRRYPPGVVRPLGADHARLRVGATEVSSTLDPDVEAACFEVTLPAGPVRLQTWLRDARSGRSRGAYYLTAHRIGLRL